MEFEDAVEKLIDGSALLFTGAGFSDGAINLRDKPFLKSHELAKYLADSSGIKSTTLSLEDAAEAFIESLVDTHHDICELKYGNLGPLAKSLYGRVQDNKSSRLGKHALKELIVQAIIAEFLEFSELKQRVQEDIAEMLPIPQ